MSDCPSCKKFVPPGVKFCPYCGESLGGETPKPTQAETSFWKRKTHPAAWAVIIPFAAIMIWGTFFHKDDPCGGDIDAATFVEFVAKGFLKSPASAEFQNVYDAEITSSACGVYRVRTLVNSQNGFGAMVATPIDAEVVYRGDGKWRLSYLRLAGKLVQDNR